MHDKPWVLLEQLQKLLDWTKQNFSDPGDQKQVFLALVEYIHLPNQGY